METTSLFLHSGPDQHFATHVFAVIIEGEFPFLFLDGRGTSIVKRGEMTTA